VATCRDSVTADSSETSLQRRTPRNAAAIVIALYLGAAACLSSPQHHRIALATTTSVNNSGLLDVVLPAFRSQTGTDVQLVTPGSGIPLDMLARGDLDVVISHAPAREAEVMTRRTWRYDLPWATSVRPRRRRLIELSVQRCFRPNALLADTDISGSR
jgi:hypothetical protein